MIHAIAIDDEPLGLEIIAHYCSTIDFITLEKTFTQQTEALKYLNKQQVDLIFLDIQMPTKNGVDFYKELKNSPMVIFTTAFSEYAVEGFNVNATDFLLKPFSKDRFLIAAEKAKKEFEVRKNNPSQNHLMIRANYKLNKIEFKSILLIEGLDDYIQIHLNNNTKIVARLSMKSILEKLPEKEFIRVHRSYIVPKNKVKAIKNKNLQIEGFVIPIGDTYKDDILKHFNV